MLQDGPIQPPEVPAQIPASENTVLRNVPLLADENDIAFLS
jgi:hypothetical protein